MLKSGFDPNFNTNTVDDFTSRTINSADGKWLSQEIPAGSNLGPFYRVHIGDWHPSRENEEGRWAGIEKPTSMAEAHQMYYLPNIDLSKLWKLYTFYIKPKQNVFIFKSKVKNGTSWQIKIPNSVCQFIAIENIEQIK